MMNLDYEYHKLQCSKCGKKILVEINQIGVSHIAHIGVTCADCLDDKINEDFKKERPDDEKDIREWIKNV